MFIRLQRQLLAVPEEIRITGVVYLPWRPGDPITSQLLRELPTARIEAAINKRLFAMTRTSTITGGKIELPSGRKVAERDLLKPLDDPKQTPADRLVAWERWREVSKPMKPLYQEFVALGNEGAGVVVDAGAQEDIPPCQKRGKCS